MCSSFIYPTRSGLSSRARPRGCLFALIAALAVLLAACGDSSSGQEAQNYPTREVTIVVPFPPGGPTDRDARIVAPRLEKALGQTVVVENVAGGSGAVGTSRVIGAKPDGYTLIMATLANAVAAPLTGQSGYSRDDFATIGLIELSPGILVVSADARYESAEKLFQAAEAKPNSISVATNGALTAQHLDLERLARERDVPIKIVPFEGSAQAIPALLGDNVDALAAQSEQIPLIRAGKFKPLGVFAEERSSFLPDTPTLREQGYNLTGGSFIGLAAPKDTPREVVSTLEAALEETLKDPTVGAKFKQSFVEPSFLSSSEFRGLIDELAARFEPVLASK